MRRINQNPNPLNIKPGDVIKDLRPLQYGKQHIVSHQSRDKMFAGWFVTTTGVMLCPKSVSLVKRNNGHLV